MLILINSEYWLKFYICLSCYIYWTLNVLYYSSDDKTDRDYECICIILILLPFFLYKNIKYCQGSIFIFHSVSRLAIIATFISQHL